MTNLKCIILVEKRVIILIHGANRWDHTNNLFYNFRILKFNDIVELKTSFCYVPNLRGINSNVILRFTKDTLSQMSRARF